ncbi:calpain-7 isoform X2 [Periophthalmus magnuspinnatus]|uniref:calpain-7 isoform X2 n=1 Tax=Periophthalmus magnuspinnatus TaxID=409849 RepID=UPI00145B7660|nr:calpain-7 isoform X2 [Periophthalmus magnuspinnatus]
MDCTALEHDAVKFAKTAVTYDQNGKYNEAVFYYKEAAQALLYAAMAGSKLEGIQNKVSEYLDRVQALHGAVQAQKSDPLKSRQQVDLERAHFLVTQAFEEDEKGNLDEAIELYTQAVELCIQTSNETTDQVLQNKLKQLARQALDRAEGLKAAPAQSSDRAGGSAPRPVSGGSSGGPVRQFFPLGPDFSLHDKPQPMRAVQSCEPQGQKYTADEIQVLRTTSTINGIPYVPFMSVDLKERFAFPVPFSDKVGKLALSPKQKAIFSRWVRPDEFCTNPTMIMSVSSFSIKQTVVSDCSFVASLAISAAYERRYNKKLITSIIYPQNRKGEPEYNPCGKYMVKLHINGVSRKVIIDDYLPVDRNGELLCSYSSNRNELWVSLIEKAYMKVMGGYDFPGSNSNIDLHALTGWIPERIAMHSDNHSFSKDGTFRMLYQRFHRGDVLITTATGVMTEEEGERWGLVPTHAYAVLDIREYKGMRFLQLKNPWSHLRWKGRYSERDEKNWTPELLKYLNFDPKTAQKFDNGVFWIAWEDLCQYYDVIYLSWNPALFKESFCIHRMTLHKTKNSSLLLFTKTMERRCIIQVYSVCKFNFSKISNPFTHVKRINGQWKGASAGGCGNYKDSYKHNPIYQINLERSGPLLIELRGSRQYSVGFEMVTVSTSSDPGAAGFNKKNSGDYRCGFCYMELDHVPAGIYNVIPTTFLPKQEGPFFLDFSTTSPVKVSQLQ